MRSKSAVTAENLKSAWAPRGSKKVQVLFRDTSGLASVEGRETLALLSWEEVAKIIGAIPALDLGDEMFPAYIKVLRFLERYGKEEK